MIAGCRPPTQPAFTYSFDYTLANQISEKTISNVAYVYDGSGRLDTSYVVNNLNQYTNVSDTAANYAPAYDLNGNFLSDGQVWTYEYDIQNRLTLAVNTVGGATVSIEYDPLGRMSARELNGAGRIEMVYDGTALLVQVDAAGAVTDRWAWGPGVDEPVAWSFGAGILSRRYMLTDHQGSIIGRAQTNGASDFIHFYDEWGVVQDTALMNFKYTGQYYDTPLGLYYYKARWYSPTLGRFLNPDPIGFEDNPNLYAYVNNDPVNGRDPTGEEGVPKEGILGLIFKVEKAATKGNTVKGIERSARTEKRGISTSSVANAANFVAETANAADLPRGQRQH